MLDRTALTLLLIATLSACGGDDDGDSSDGARDDGGGGNGDGGGGNNADAAVATCDPVAGTDLALAPVASGLNDPVFVTSPRHAGATAVQPGRRKVRPCTSFRPR